MRVAAHGDHLVHEPAARHSPQLLVHRHASLQQGGPRWVRWVVGEEGGVGWVGLAAGRRVCACGGGQRCPAQ